MAELWKGAPVAAAITEQLTARTAALVEQGVTPTLAILRVGERPDDMAYERGATNRCGKIGVAVKKILLSADCTQEELLAEIEKINTDDTIHGCLMFRPLPKHIDERTVCEALRPEKDVDGITSGSLASVFAGDGPGYPPCTAQACMELLEHYGCKPEGKRAVVIGRSLVIGKPVAMLLMGKNATVTMCHTRTRDMAALCRQAEVLVVAAGKAGVVDGSFIAPGQVVLDVGIHDDGNGGLCGDVQFDQAEPVAAAITPVPGGVGTVTSTVLARHVVEAAEKAAKRK